ncbi:MAG: NACHT domain-containing protein [Egibacteraceae bacterium]
MLDRVHTAWIKGVLKRSLDATAWMDLGLQGRPDAVHPRPGLVAHQPSGDERVLPAGMPASAVFEELGQALLILGAPGSGKTTFMLELARELLERAQRDDEHPIPVVFSLASWAVQRRPLAEWFVDELAEAYDIPRRVGQAWVDAEQILPLLDGLDDVAVQHLDGCVEAINGFRRDHGLLPIAVCSRTAEYAALPMRLRLLGAVEIQPLTHVQIAAHLERVGRPLAGVRAALQDDPTLWELVETPLMLSIVVLTCQGNSAATLSAGGTPQQQRQQLFAAYVAAMFQRRPEDRRYPKHKTVRWLAQLGRFLQQHNQTDFYLERIQRDWLATRAQQRVVTISSAVLIGLLVGSLIRGSDGATIGLLSALCYGLGERSGATQQTKLLRWSWAVARKGLAAMLFVGLAIGLAYGVVRGPLVGLAFGLVEGTLAGLLAGLLSTLAASQACARETNLDGGVLRLNSHPMLGHLVAGLVVGVVFGLVGAVILGLKFTILNGLTIGFANALRAQLIPALLITVFYMLIFGLPLALSYGLEEYSPVTSPSERLRSLWSLIREEFQSMVPVALIVGAVVGLGEGLFHGPVVGLFDGLAFGLLAGLAVVLVNEPLADQRRAPQSNPNEGTQRSARNALIAGALVGLAVQVLTVVTSGMTDGLILGPVYGLMAGLAYDLGARSQFIQPIQRLRWSWAAVRRHLKSTLVIGLLVGVLIALIAGFMLMSGEIAGGPYPILVSIIGVLIVAQLFGLVAVLVMGLLSGLSINQLATSQTAPNEIIRRSARNALLAGALFAALFAASFRLSTLAGMVNGLLVWAIAALFVGGMACLQHLMVRALLVRNGFAPRQYVRFLDYATERLFLRQIGAGYIFSHRLLLEYFATLELDQGREPVILGVEEAGRTA